MSGSTRKLHRQKGTGGSRKGSIKSPLFKGGARVFGPKPRDYHFKLNKKVKDLARRSALTYKAKDGTLKVIDTVSMSAPKTSEFAALLKAFELSARKSILVVPSKDDNIVLSARNLQNTRVVVASELNTYDIMNAKGLLIVKDAIAPLETILTK